MVNRFAGPCPMDGLSHVAEVDGLRFSERMVLWTLRLWQQSLFTGGEARMVLVEAYARLGVDGAVAAIDGTLWPHRVGALRDIRFEAPNRGRLNADEIRMLHLLALYQKGMLAAARPIHDATLTPTAARSVQSPLSVWSALLEQAGLTLPLRDWILPELTPAPKRDAATLRTATLH